MGRRQRRRVKRLARRRARTSTRKRDRLAAESRATTYALAAAPLIGPTLADIDAIPLDPDPTSRLIAAGYLPDEDGAVWFDDGY